MYQVRNSPVKKVLFMILFLAGFHFSNAQGPENAEKVYHFNGSVSVTNNGFSFIPLFTLGKPAAITDLSVGGERFSFDPQFRFDLDGLKPWSFIFIWRYNLVRTERFLLKPGMHLPALSFREETIEKDGITKERVVPVRFLTPELTAAYTLSGNISIGTYYIYGIGLEKVDQTRQTHFISLRFFFSRVPLGKKFYLNWNPQLYYLNMDGVDGYFAAHSLSLSHEKLPLSVATTMNIKIRSSIETRDFDWNISVVYSFRNQLLRQ